jgi:hypothetical protein
MIGRLGGNIITGSIVDFLMLGYIYLHFFILGKLLENQR